MQNPFDFTFAIQFVDGDPGQNVLNVGGGVATGDFIGVIIAAILATIAVAAGILYFVKKSQLATFQTVTGAHVTMRATSKAKSSFAILALAALALCASAATFIGSGAAQAIAEGGQVGIPIVKAQVMDDGTININPITIKNQKGYDIKVRSSQLELNDEARSEAAFQKGIFENTTLDGVVYKGSPSVNKFQYFKYNNEKTGPWPRIEDGDSAELKISISGINANTANSYLNQVVYLHQITFESAEVDITEAINFDEFSLVDEGAFHETGLSITYDGKFHNPLNYDFESDAETEGHTYPYYPDMRKTDFYAQDVKRVSEDRVDPYHTKIILKPGFVIKSPASPYIEEELTEADIPWYIDPAPYSIITKSLTKTYDMYPFYYENRGFEDDAEIIGLQTREVYPSIPFVGQPTIKQEISTVVYSENQDPVIHVYQSGTKNFAQAKWIDSMPPSEMQIPAKAGNYYLDKGACKFGTLTIEPADYVFVVADDFEATYDATRQGRQVYAATLEDFYGAPDFADWNCDPHVYSFYYDADGEFIDTYYSLHDYLTVYDYPSIENVKDSCTVNYSVYSELYIDDTLYESDYKTDAGTYKLTINPRPFVFSQQTSEGSHEGILAIGLDGFDTSDAAHLQGIIRNDLYYHQFGDTSIITPDFGIAKRFTYSIPREKGASVIQVEGDDFTFSNGSADLGTHNAHLTANKGSNFIGTTNIPFTIIQPTEIYYNNLDGFSILRNFGHEYGSGTQLVNVSPSEAWLEEGNPICDGDHGYNPIYGNIDDASLAVTWNRLSDEKRQSYLENGFYINVSYTLPGESATSQDKDFFVSPKLAQEMYEASQSGATLPYRLPIKVKDKYASSMEVSIDFAAHNLTFNDTTTPAVEEAGMHTTDYPMSHVEYSDPETGEWKLWDTDGQTIISGAKLVKIQNNMLKVESGRAEARDMYIRIVPGKFNPTDDSAIDVYNDYVNEHYSIDENTISQPMYIVTDDLQINYHLTQAPRYRLFENVDAKWFTSSRTIPYAVQEGNCPINLGETVYEGTKVTVAAGGTSFNSRFGWALKLYNENNDLIDTYYGGGTNSDIIFEMPACSIRMEVEPFVQVRFEETLEGSIDGVSYELNIEEGNWPYYFDPDASSFDVVYVPRNTKFVASPDGDSLYCEYGANESVWTGKWEGTPYAPWLCEDPETVTFTVQAAEGYTFDGFDALYTADYDTPSAQSLFQTFTINLNTEKAHVFTFNDETDNGNAPEEEGVVPGSYVFSHIETQINSIDEDGWVPLEDNEVAAPKFNYLEKVNGHNDILKAEVEGNLQFFKIVPGVWNPEGEANPIKAAYNKYITDHYFVGDDTLSEIYDVASHDSLSYELQQIDRFGLTIEDNGFWTADMDKADAITIPKALSKTEATPAGVPVNLDIDEYGVYAGTELTVNYVTSGTGDDVWQPNCGWQLVVYVGEGEFKFPVAATPSWELSGKITIPDAEALDFYGLSAEDKLTLAIEPFMIVRFPDIKDPTYAGFNQLNIIHGGQTYLCGNYELFVPRFSRFTSNFEESPSILNISAPYASIYDANKVSGSDIIKVNNASQFQYEMFTEPYYEFNGWDVAPGIGSFADYNGHEVTHQQYNIDISFTYIGQAIVWDESISSVTVNGQEYTEGSATAHYGDEVSFKPATTDDTFTLVAKNSVTHETSYTYYQASDPYVIESGVYPIQMPQTGGLSISVKDDYEITGFNDTTEPRIYHHEPSIIQRSQDGGQTWSDLETNDGIFIPYAAEIETYSKDGMGYLTYTYYTYNSTTVGWTNKVVDMFRIVPQDTAYEFAGFDNIERGTSEINYSFEHAADFYKFHELEVQDEQPIAEISDFNSYNYLITADEDGLWSGVHTNEWLNVTLDSTKFDPLQHQYLFVWQQGSPSTTPKLQFPINPETGEIPSFQMPDYNATLSVGTLTKPRIYFNHSDLLDKIAVIDSVYIENGSVVETIPWEELKDSYYELKDGNDVYIDFDFDGDIYSQWYWQRFGDDEDFKFTVNSYDKEADKVIGSYGTYDSEYEYYHDEDGRYIGYIYLDEEEPMEINSDVTIDLAAHNTCYDSLDFDTVIPFSCNNVGFYENIMPAMFYGDYDDLNYVNDDDFNEALLYSLAEGFLFAPQGYTLEVTQEVINGVSRVDVLNMYDPNNTNDKYWIAFFDTGENLEDPFDWTPLTRDSGYGFKQDCLTWNPDYYDADTDDNIMKNLISYDQLQLEIIAPQAIRIYFNHAELFDKLGDVESVCIDMYTDSDNYDQYYYSWDLLKNGYVVVPYFGGDVEVDIDYYNKEAFGWESAYPAFHYNYYDRNTDTVTGSYTTEDASWYDGDDYWELYDLDGVQINQDVSIDFAQLNDDNDPQSPLQCSDVVLSDNINIWAFSGSFVDPEVIDEYWGYFDGCIIAPLGYIPEILRNQTVMYTPGVDVLRFRNRFNPSDSVWYTFCSEGIEGNPIPLPLISGYGFDSVDLVDPAYSTSQFISYDQYKVNLFTEYNPRVYFNHSELLEDYGDIASIYVNGNEVNLEKGYYELQDGESTVKFTVNYNNVISDPDHPLNKHDLLLHVNAYKHYIDKVFDYNLDISLDKSGASPFLTLSNEVPFPIHGDISVDLNIMMPDKNGVLNKITPFTPSDDNIKLLPYGGSIDSPVFDQEEIDAFEDFVKYGFIHTALGNSYELQHDVTIGGITGVDVLKSIPYFEGSTTYFAFFDTSSGNPETYKAVSAQKGYGFDPFSPLVWNDGYWDIESDEQLKDVIATDQVDINLLTPQSIIGKRIYFKNLGMLRDMGTIPEHGLKVNGEDVNLNKGYYEITEDDVDEGGVKILVSADYDNNPAWWSRAKAIGLSFNSYDRDNELITGYLDYYEFPLTEPAENNASYETSPLWITQNVSVDLGMTNTSDEICYPIKFEGDKSIGDNTGVLKCSGSYFFPNIQWDDPDIGMCEAGYMLIKRDSVVNKINTTVMGVPNVDVITVEDPNNPEAEPVWYAFFNVTSQSYGGYRPLSCDYGYGFDITWNEIYQKDGQQIQNIIAFDQLYMEAITPRSVEEKTIYFNHTGMMDKIGKNFEIYINGQKVTGDSYTVDNVNPLFIKLSWDEGEFNPDWVEKDYLMHLNSYDSSAGNVTGSLLSYQTDSDEEDDYCVRNTNPIFITEDVTFDLVLENEYPWLNTFEAPLECDAVDLPNDIYCSWFTGDFSNPIHIDFVDGELLHDGLINFAREGCTYVVEQRTVAGFNNVGVLVELQPGLSPADPRNRWLAFHDNNNKFISSYDDYAFESITWNPAYESHDFMAQDQLKVNIKYPQHPRIYFNHTELLEQIGDIESVTFYKLGDPESAWTTIPWYDLKNNFYEITFNTEEENIIFYVTFSELADPAPAWLVPENLWLEFNCYDRTTNKVTKYYDWDSKYVILEDNELHFDTEETWGVEIVDDVCLDLHRYKSVWDDATVMPLKCDNISFDENTNLVKCRGPYEYPTSYEVVDTIEYGYILTYLNSYVSIEKNQTVQGVSGVDVLKVIEPFYNEADDYTWYAFFDTTSGAPDTYSPIPLSHGYGFKSLDWNDDYTSQTVIGADQLKVNILANHPGYKNIYFNHIDAINNLGTLLRITVNSQILYFNEGYISIPEDPFELQTINIQVVYSQLKDPSSAEFLTTLLRLNVNEYNPYINKVIGNNNVFGDIQYSTFDGLYGFLIEIPYDSMPNDFTVDWAIDNLSEVQLPLKCSSFDQSEENIKLVQFDGNYLNPEVFVNQQSFVDSQILDGSISCLLESEIAYENVTISGEQGAEKVDVLKCGDVAYAFYDYENEKFVSVDDGYGLDPNNPVEWNNQYWDLENDEQLTSIIGADQCKINLMRKKDIVGKKIYFNHAKLLEESGVIQSIKFNNVEKSWQDIVDAGYCYTLTKSDYPLVITVNLNVEDHPSWFVGNSMVFNLNYYDSEEDKVSGYCNSFATALTGVEPNIFLANTEHPMTITHDVCLDFALIENDIIEYPTKFSEYNNESNPVKLVVFSGDFYNPHKEDIWFQEAFSSAIRNGYIYTDNGLHAEKINTVVDGVEGVDVLKFNNVLGTDSLLDGCWFAFCYVEGSNCQPIPAADGYGFKDLEWSEDYVKDGGTLQEVIAYDQLEIGLTFPHSEPGKKIYFDYTGLISMIDSNFEIYINDNKIDDLSQPYEIDSKDAIDIKVVWPDLTDDPDWTDGIKSFNLLTYKEGKITGTYDIFSAEEDDGAVSLTCHSTEEIYITEDVCLDLLGASQNDSIDGCFANVNNLDTSSQIIPVLLQDDGEGLYVQDQTVCEDEYAYGFMFWPFGKDIKITTEEIFGVENVETLTYDFCDWYDDTYTNKIAFFDTHGTEEYGTWTPVPKDAGFGIKSISWNTDFVNDGQLIKDVIGSNQFTVNFRTNYDPKLHFDELLKTEGIKIAVDDTVLEDGQTSLYVPDGEDFNLYIGIDSLMDETSANEGGYSAWGVECESKNGEITKYTGLADLERVGQESDDYDWDVCYKWTWNTSCDLSVEFGVDGWIYMYMDSEIPDDVGLYRILDDGSGASNMDFLAACNGCKVSTVKHKVGNVENVSVFQAFNADDTLAGEFAFLKDGEGEIADKWSSDYEFVIAPNPKFEGITLDSPVYSAIQFIITCKSAEEDLAVANSLELQSGGALQQGGDVQQYGSAVAPGEQSGAVQPQPGVEPQSQPAEDPWWMDSIKQKYYGFLNILLAALFLLV